MDLIPDRPNKCQQIIRYPSKNDLPLRPGAPQSHPEDSPRSPENIKRDPTNVKKVARKRQHIFHK